MAMSRRHLLMTAGAGVFLGTDALEAITRGAQNKTKRVLFFTKSSGFQHSVVTRKGGQPAHAEKILTDLGREHGFEVVASKDGRLFDPDKIGQWDAFAFYTTGDLTTPGPHKDGEPMSADGKKAFLDAIHGGKGYIGFHCASDTFHSKPNEIDPYIQMLGGEFIVHGAQQKSKLITVDPKFPGAGAFGESYELIEEWYALKNQPEDLHVVLIQDTTGMNGKMYQRPNFPQTWVRLHGKGRVCYTSLGHREDVWENAKFQGLTIGGLKWITGQAEADTTPNITKVTPGYNQIPV